jgi:virginiamycin B lyase
MKTTVLTLITTFTCLHPVMHAQTDPASTSLYKAFKQVSAPGDGVMYALTHDDAIYRWTGVDWAQVEGALRQISAGSKTDVWGVNASNQVWQATDTGWIRRPGLMRQVAVSRTFKGNTGPATIVGLDLNGKPFLWDSQGSWKAFPNSPVLREIAIGRPTQIYGIGLQDEIYRWKASSNTWFRLKGSLRNISVGADGSVGGVNAQKVGYLRSDADVEDEMEESTDTANWAPLPVTMEGLVILDSKTVLAADSAGMMIQMGNPASDEVITLRNAELTVTGSFFSPPSYVTNNDANAPVFTSNGCIYLKGNLRLDLPGSPVISTPPTALAQCIKVTSFASIAVPPVTNSDGVIFMKPLTYGDDIPGGRDNLGKSREFLPNRYRTGLPLACSARNFLNLSHRSWVQFQMPWGQQGELIMIPGGAYNNYVLPSCNRVWWTDLVFACTIPPGSKDWQWTLLGGKYDADAGCTGSPGSRYYFSYGNW